MTDDESKVRMFLKAPHIGVTPHGKPLRSAKATNPKGLLMVLPPSMGSGKGMFHGTLCYSGNIGGGGGSEQPLSNTVLPGARYCCLVAAHF